MQIWFIIFKMCMDTFLMCLHQLDFNSGIEQRFIFAFPAKIYMCEGDFIKASHKIIWKSTAQKKDRLWYINTCQIHSNVIRLGRARIKHTKNTKSNGHTDNCLIIGSSGVVKNHGIIQLPQSKWWNPEGYGSMSPKNPHNGGNDDEWLLVPSHTSQDCQMAWQLAI